MKDAHKTADEMASQYGFNDEQKEFHTPYEDSLRKIEQERLKIYADTAADPRHIIFDIFYHEPQFIGKIHLKFGKSRGYRSVLFHNLKKH